MKRFIWISTLLYAVAFATAVLAQEPVSAPASVASTAPVTAGTVTVAFNAAVLQTAEAQREQSIVNAEVAITMRNPAWWACSRIIPKPQEWR